MEGFPRNVGNWYRLGLEWDPEASIVRAYMSPTATALSDGNDVAGNNAAMIITATLSGDLLFFPPWRFALAIGGINSTVGSGNTRVDNFVCEEMHRAPFLPGGGPTGSFFPAGLSDEPGYTLYKSVSSIYHLLLFARI